MSRLSGYLNTGKKELRSGLDSIKSAEWMVVVGKSDKQILINV